MKKLIILLVVVIYSSTNNIKAQNNYSLYETIDSTNSFGVKEIMVKISNDAMELYTLPKVYGMGRTTANKGRIIEEDNSLYFQIDTTWIFSSNFVHLTNLRINCAPKLKIEFNNDSTFINLKILENSNNTESFESDSSSSKFRMVCGCIEEYKELNLCKVDYFENEFDWNCGAFKNWKRRLKYSTVTDCSN